MHGHSCVPRELDHLSADIALASASLRVDTSASSSASAFLDPRLRVADLRRQARELQRSRREITVTRTSRFAPTGAAA